ncbi:helix-turn-helix domain-containing protein [Rubrobacter indicoceani]|uniref:helix-turn-helix domain-containing protein n=1 Tax=Rubrobacter indicoceani TaxID=2051957 RepID=UPI000E5A167D|nr:helix-turn-helix domain-containing protein [Rubrobacter indicoceani]
MSRSYSVDEVSDLLVIPRPTLYRYLREYDIPSRRRSGRISIPEESVEKIRRVRDLHREGMGTGSVRRMIEAPPKNTDEVEITNRLDRITRELQGVRIERPPENLSSEQAVRTLLARQTLLISAVINLTEMVEEMMRSSGRQVHRRSQAAEPPVVRHGLRDTSREVPLATVGHRSSSASGGVRRGGVRPNPDSVGATKTVTPTTFAASRSVRVSSRRRPGPEKRVGYPSPADRAPTGARRGRRSGVRHRRSDYGSLARRRRKIIGGLLAVGLLVFLGLLFAYLVPALLGTLA